MRFAIILCLVLGAPVIGAQVPSSTCCTLTVRIEQPATPTVLKVTITNVSSTAVVLFDSNPERDIRLRVTTRTGADVERTEYGKQVLARRRAFRNIRVELKPGEAFSQTVDVGKLFQTGRGSYYVLISRVVFVGSDSPTELHTLISLGSQ